LASLTATAALTGGLAAATTGTASAATTPPPEKYIIDTGWVTDYDGSCKAKAHVEYYPGSDKAYFETTVQSPFVFAGCEANTNLSVKTAGDTFQGAVHRASACATWDPTCPSLRMTPGTYIGATVGLNGYVDSVNDALEAAGLPRSYTRRQAVRSISVSFTKA